ncbi:MAG: hypothetical protein MHM6MM_000568 [Cercozoa sp. M6MM]
MQWLAPGIGSLCCVAFAWRWHMKNQPQPRLGRAVDLSFAVHRGGGAECYENTILAFRHAVSLGATHLEMDVHLTRDGKVVVVHDDSLVRLCGKNVRVRDLRLSELPPLLPASQLLLPPPFHAATKTLQNSLDELSLNISGAEEDRRIPLLEEVFAEFKDAGVSFNIDLKRIDDDEAVASLVRETGQLIRKYGLTERVVWGSTAARHSLHCHSEFPDIPLFFSLKRVAMLLLCYTFGLLWALPVHEGYLEIPLFAPKQEERLLLPRLGPYSEWKWYVKLLVRWYTWATSQHSLYHQLHQRGVRVCFWVLNDASEFTFAQTLPAHGLMTDCPTYFVRHAETARGL